MAQTFNLKVLTPERQVCDCPVESLTVTTTDGQFEFLAHHVPIVMPLVVGTLQLRKPDQSVEKIFNSEGFLEVRHDEILVYAQACETPEEIDRRRAEESLQRAEERLRQRQSMKEYQQSKMALARAMARLQVKKTRQ